MKCYLEISHKTYNLIINHLLPPNPIDEESAFIFAESKVENNTIEFKYLDSILIPNEGYTFKSGCFIQLNNDTKAKVIKRAYDLKASMIELHSHIIDRPAEFSISDFEGFKDFVPNVQWRLGGKPYAAIVVSQNSFDGLVWPVKNSDPVPLSFIKIDKRLIYPTGLSNKRNYEYGEK